MRFNEKRVLVTGASRGIGRAVALLFAEEGARVAVHYHRNQPAAREVYQNLFGQGHCMLQADISEAEECQRLVEETIQALGGIDILVNNAGVFW